MKTECVTEKKINIMLYIIKFSVRQVKKMPLSR